MSSHPQVRCKEPVLPVDKVVLGIADAFRERQVILSLWHDMPLYYICMWVPPLLFLFGIQFILGNALGRAPFFCNCFTVLKNTHCPKEGSKAIGVGRSPLYIHSQAHYLSAEKLLLSWIWGMRIIRKYFSSNQTKTVITIIVEFSRCYI